MGRSAYFDERVQKQADDTIKQVVGDFTNGTCNVVGERFAGVVMAPAGAGKSFLGTTAVARAVESREGQLSTVAVGTPTNDQAYSFVDTLSDRFRELDVAFVHSQDHRLPEHVATRPNVHDIEAKDAAHHTVVVGTLDKLGDAYARDALPEFSYLVVDEAFQADGGKYFKVAGLSDRHLLIGDYGQLEPFNTMQDPGRWRGLPEDPTQTSVAVLRRNHSSCAEYKLPITRRLPPSALPVIQAFYPKHDFSSWTLPDARAARLAPAKARGGLAALDAALESMTNRGWAWLRLPSTPVLTADPLTIDVITSLVRRLKVRSLERRDEKTRGQWRHVSEDDVAVVVSHNDQKGYLRVALAAAGLADVRVDTANKLQGLQFDFVIAWHPLAGLPEGDAFHLEPGRLCVMLTRHRHGCIVVGRRSDPDLVDELPPAGETWIGHDSDPVLDGWMAHSLVFASLGNFAVDLGSDDR